MLLEKLLFIVTSLKPGCLLHLLCQAALMTVILSVHRWMLVVVIHLISPFEAVAYLTAFLKDSLWLSIETKSYSVCRGHWSGAGGQKLDICGTNVHHCKNGLHSTVQSQQSSSRWDQRKENTHKAVKIRLCFVAEMLAKGLTINDISEGTYDKSV